MVTFSGTPLAFSQYIANRTAVSSGVTNIVGAEADNDVVRLGISAFAQTILDDANAAAVLTTIGAQAHDAALQSLAGLTYAAGQFIMASAPDTFVAQNIIGTVSEAAGKPTGAWAQRGSNANGEYVMYADGRMECTFTDAGGQATNTAEGNVFSSGTTQTWTFPTPVAFAAAPVVHVCVNTINRWATHSAPSTTSVTYRQYSATNTASTAITASMTAVGRWF